MIVYRTVTTIYFPIIIGTIYNNHTGYGPNKGYYEGMDLGEIWGYQADDLFMTNREIDDYLRKVDMSALKPDDMWRQPDTPKSHQDPSLHNILY